MLARTLLVATIVSTASVADAAPGVGLMTDVGVPDGANASVVVRPLRMLRVHAGGGHNYVSPGIRGGLTFVPLPFWFTPTATLDVGHYFEGDANPLARKISGDASFQQEALERVGYDYMNAHVGLEFGRQRATFYIHAGMSRISGKVHGLEAMASDSGTTVTFSEDPDVTLWTVSARVGLVVYLVP